MTSDQAADLGVQGSTGQGSEVDDDAGSLLALYMCWASPAPNNQTLNDNSTK